MPLSHVHLPRSSFVEDRFPPALNTTPIPFEKVQAPPALYMPSFRSRILPPFQSGARPLSEVSPAHAARWPLSRTKPCRFFRQSHRAARLRYRRLLSIAARPSIAIPSDLYCLPIRALTTLLRYFWCFRPRRTLHRLPDPHHVFAGGRRQRAVNCLLRFGQSHRRMRPRRCGRPFRAFRTRQERSAGPSGCRHAIQSTSLRKRLQRPRTACQRS
jgi:hypothetical protein